MEAGLKVFYEDYLAEPPMEYFGIAGEYPKVALGFEQLSRLPNSGLHVLGQLHQIAGHLFRIISWRLVGTVLVVAYQSLSVLRLLELFVFDLVRQRLLIPLQTVPLSVEPPLP